MFTPRRNGIFLVTCRCKTWTSEHSLRVWSLSNSLTYTVPSLAHLSKHWFRLQHSSSAGRRDMKRKHKKFFLVCPILRWLPIFSEDLPSMPLRMTFTLLSTFTSSEALWGACYCSAGLQSLRFPPAVVLLQFPVFPHSTPCRQGHPISFLGILFKQDVKKFSPSFLSTWPTSGP